MRIAVVEKRDAGGNRNAALELIAQARQLGECALLQFSFGGLRPPAESIAAALAPKARDFDLVLIPATPSGRPIAEHLASALGRLYVPNSTDLTRIRLPAVASVAPGTFPLSGEPPIPEVIAVEVTDERAAAEDVSSP